MFVHALIKAQTAYSVFWCKKERFKLRSRNFIWSRRM